MYAAWWLPRFSLQALKVPAGQITGVLEMTTASTAEREDALLKSSPQVRRRLLVVRQEGDGTFKYSLSNAPENTSWERLAFMQAQRYWIEQSFKEAKSELGMAHYEVRGWRGWHHHMALVCLAQLFTLRQRLEVRSPHFVWLILVVHGCLRPTDAPRPPGQAVAPQDVAHAAFAGVQSRGHQALQLVVQFRRPHKGHCFFKAWICASISSLTALGWLCGALVPQAGPVLLLEA